MERATKSSNTSNPIQAVGAGSEAEERKGAEVVTVDVGNDEAALVRDGLQSRPEPAPARVRRADRRVWTMSNGLGGPGWWLGRNGQWNPPGHPMPVGYQPVSTMHDQLGGAGWWLGEDGRWYPPDPPTSLGASEAGARPEPSSRPSSRPHPQWGDADAGSSPRSMARRNDPALSRLRPPPSLDRTRSRRDQRRFERRQTPKMRLSVLVLLMVGITAVFLRINRPHHSWLNYFLSVAWALNVPLVIVGVTGAIYLRLGRRFVYHPPGEEAPGTRPNARGRRTTVDLRKLSRSSYTRRTDRQLIVTVPTLLAPGNLAALQRVLLSLLVNLPRNFTNFRVDVITEDGGDQGSLRAWLDELGPPAGPVRILNVPASYETKNRAKFKTRANQYAMEVRRISGENSEATFVYHLDDDTHIGIDTAASLAEFIENEGERFYLAQGILAFPHYLTPSWFCRLADSIRPADDLTRFAFFTGALGTPLGGLHGEHVIIRADIEDDIGWDFPNTVIEDAYFAIEFARRYPYRSTMLNSYSYGASPPSIGELIRQRRRWIEGLLRLACNRRLELRRKLPLVYSIATWSVAPLQFVGIALMVSYATGINNTSPVSPWIIPLWSANLAYVFWLYFEGLKVNLSASERPGSFGFLAVFLVPLIYIIALIETFGVVVGWIRFFGIGKQKVSEVIAKPM